MNARFVSIAIFSLLLLASSVFAEVDEYHVNLDGTTQVFETQNQADAYVKERGYDQYPVDHEASKIAQAKADAEFQAQKAQLDAQTQQRAVEMGTTITVNNLDTGTTQIFGTPEAIAAREQRIQGEFVLPDGNTGYHPGGIDGALADHQRGVAEMQKVWDDQKKAIQGMAADDPNSPQA